MNLRLRRARELLMLSSSPIMQITLACGFQSPSHFSKAYRAMFGHAPSRERRHTSNIVRPKQEAPSDSGRSGLRNW
jgi:transcriptional regulator GlxA family with amidase domain